MQIEEILSSQRMRRRREECINCNHFIILGLVRIMFINFHPYKYEFIYRMPFKCITFRVVFDFELSKLVCFQWQTVLNVPSLNEAPITMHKLKININ